MSESMGSLLGDMIATARSLARQHNLITEAGTIVCWACGERRALMPSLHCHVCLAAAHRRVGRVAPLCVNREQTPEDIACHASG